MGEWMDRCFDGKESFKPELSFERQPSELLHMHTHLLVCVRVYFQVLDWQYECSNNCNCCLEDCVFVDVDFIFFCELMAACLLSPGMKNQLVL